MWPGTAFRPRAERIEAELQRWGQALYDAVFANAPDILAAWQNDPAASRSFSIQVKTTGQGGEDDEAAAHLLSLPWELLHDGNGYLFQTETPTCVRRLRSTRRLGTMALDMGPAGAPALPGYPAVEPPIRILLVTSRPETESCRYLDHRVSAEALVAAMETLGNLVEFTLLTEPTFDAMCDELQAAADRDAPYHVLHFDGHGTYSPELKQGGLLFEDPTSFHKLFDRRSKTIFTKQLAADLAPFQLPLVFLEACQTAKAETGVNGSVASALLDAGVSSVVAMSHNVLVETARRFVVTFYTALVQGQSVGDAVLAGQRKLHLDPFRGRVFGAGTFELQDWFVPVLYQFDADPVLFQPTKTKEHQAAPSPTPSALPNPPPTGFIGRSRELLALQRLLFPAPGSLYQSPHWTLLRGQGGEGKTALATEFARWSLRLGLIERAAFVSVETDAHEEDFLLQLGLQLVGDHYLPAHDPNHQDLIDALQDSTTLLIIDNCETLEPDFFHDDRDAILNRTKALLESAPNTLLVFTSRETLPAPFHATAREIHLHRLARDDAKRLIERSLNLDEAFLFPDEETEHAHENELNALIDATQGHARTLSLIAPHLKTDGIAATTHNLTQLMIEMEEKFPGDREQSLFASIELSLQRLSPESHELCKPLGLFCGVANMPLFSDMLETEISTVRKMGKELIGAGLARPATGTVLHFHPALCPYLDWHLTDKERSTWMPAWMDAMRYYVTILGEMHEIEPQLAAELILLARPNLVALLHRFSGRPPSETVDLCTDLFQILQTLGQPRLLETVASIRNASKAELGSHWSADRFEAERVHIEEQLSNGDLEETQKAAQTLLANTLSAGVGAYRDAAFDIAVARLLLGRTLRKRGLPEGAIESLKEAQRGFDKMEGKAASRMSSACTTEMADSFRDMGHLSDAAELYKIGIETSEALGDKRGSAVGRFQLGNIFLEQLNLDEALSVYERARGIFEGLNEPENVATAWHQIGMIHGKRKNIEAGEAAFRQSLVIDIRIQNLAGQASTYGELGILYRRSGRTKDALLNHQKAADLTVALNDTLGEARHRNNMANALFELNMYGEARREILTAIHCQSELGHNAEPWKSWDILADIEGADPKGSLENEITARKKARSLFLDYRREGGDANSFQQQLCHAICEILQFDQPSEAAKLLSNISDPEDPEEFKELHRVLTAIANGSRDPSLANDPGLDYIDSVEIQLVLETLGQASTSPD